MPIYYKLPSGIPTTNAEEYITAWHEFAAPLCDVLDMHLTAFDPDINLATIDYRYNIQLPVWFVERFNESLKKGNISK